MSYLHFNGIIEGSFLKKSNCNLKRFYFLLYGLSINDKIILTKEISLYNYQIINNPYYINTQNNFLKTKRYQSFIRSRNSKAILMIKAISYLDSLEILEYVLISLRLSIWHNIYSIALIDKYKLIIENPEMDIWGRSGHLPYNINKNEELKLRKSYKGISIFFENNKFCLEKYNKSCESTGDDLLIYACITLESCLMTSSEGEISYKLAARVLEVLCEDNDILNNYEVFDYMRKLYDIRSRIIHDGKDYRQLIHKPKIKSLFKIDDVLINFSFDYSILLFLSRILLNLVNSYGNIKTRKEYINQIDKKIINKIIKQ